MKSQYSYNRADKLNPLIELYKDKLHQKEGDWNWMNLLELNSSNRSKATWTKIRGNKVVYVSVVKR